MRNPRHKLVVELYIRDDKSAAALREENEQLADRNRELSGKLLQLNLDNLYRSSDLRPLLTASIEVLEGFPEHKQLVKQLKKRLKEESQ